MAEWAQLRAGPPVPEGLARGRWYPVHARADDGCVHLVGARGARARLHPDFVRTIHEVPAAITRISMAAFGPDDPSEFGAFLYRGVCPRGHEIGRLRPGDETAECTACDATYRIEDEDHV